MDAFKFIPEGGSQKKKKMVIEQNKTKVNFRQKDKNKIRQSKK